MTDYFVLINLASHIIFLIAFIFCISRLSIWIYRRGLTDKTLLPSVKDIVGAVLKLLNDSSEKVVVDKKKKSKGEGRYKN